jgi:hypothetical protein
MRASALQREIDQDRIASDGGLGWFKGHWTSRKSSGQAIIILIDRHSPDLSAAPDGDYPARASPKPEERL